ncbi:DNA recombination protein RecO [Flavobacterium sp. 316]|uniref:DNA repair protein RecO n=1 Tax=Flavobacterium sp. 316 TaxID=1603293 RepID=UPI0005EA0730|nr:DNA repair protein RecO [Flavobacterium sp. 316]KIX20653.1 DNA recombination protein RecO [Flavobacterium sp. 316]
MIVKTKAIVISITKYQEKSLIVKCLTKLEGVKTYFVNNAYTGKNNKYKISLFQPLNQIEVEAYHKNKGTLERFKEVKIIYPYQTVYLNIEKTAIALFLSEILQSVIKEEGKNEDLFVYIETALQWFDNHDEIANFHLILLFQITKYLGFYPQVNTEKNTFFEMTEGIFVSSPSITSLSAENTLLLKKLLNLKFDDNQKVFTSIQRQLLLKILIEYYNLNFENFKTPKSLQVLKEVFS